MTAADWQTHTDPLEMLAGLYPMRSHGSTTPQTRPCRAYLFACARARWDRLPESARALVALGELASEERHRWARLRGELEAAADALRNGDGPPAAPGWFADLRADPPGPFVLPALEHLAARGRYVPDLARPEPALEPGEWTGLARLVFLPFQQFVPQFRWVPPELHSAALLRETHGQVLARAEFAAHWVTDTAKALARDMHERQTFAAMPILADALQDAGCDDPFVLEHCRGPGPHARGCWVLDQVLGFR